MNKKELHNSIEITCLVSFYIVLFAYKDHVSWAKNVHERTPFWNLSDVTARAILVSALAISLIGVVIMVTRLYTFLQRRPTLESVMRQMKSSMKEPYEPDPWLNLGYGLIGFLSFGIPILSLCAAALLAAFFSVTVKQLISRSKLQTFFGLNN